MKARCMSLEKEKKHLNVLEEINDLDEMIASSKKLSKQYPDDKAITFTIQQDEGRKKQLLSKLEEIKAV